MRRVLLVLMACLIGAPVPGAAADADTSATNAYFLPKLPAAYQDYEIDFDSLSPDQHYAFIYPSEPPADDAAKTKNFLVALKPFRVVAEIPGDDNYFAHKNHAGFAVNWARNSSAVVVIEDSRWGPGTVYVLPIKNGQAGKIVDLTAEVTKLVEPDLKKALAEPYNENYDFIFNGDEGWTIDDKGQVEIDANCATNPKNLPGIKSWEGNLKGLWDIAQGRFVQQKYTRTFSGMYRNP